MAENEQLDATLSRKWRVVARAVAADAGPEEIGSEIERTFCRALRQMKRDGDLPALICGLNNPEAMAPALADWQGDPIVTDFFQSAARSDESRCKKVKVILNQMLDNCLFDIPGLAAQGRQPVSISLARARLAKGDAASRTRIVGRLAEGLAQNPDWSPNASPRRGQSVSGNFGSTERMLGESLLAGNVR